MIEKGTKLKAIDPCIMEEGLHEGKAALIVGKKYEIITRMGNIIAISSEVDESHVFIINELDEFFELPNEPNYDGISWDYHMIRGYKYHIAIKDDFYVAYGLTKEEAYARLQEKISKFETN